MTSGVANYTEYKEGALLASSKEMRAPSVALESSPTKSRNVPVFKFQGPFGAPGFSDCKEIPRLITIFRAREVNQRKGFPISGRQAQTKG